jgi:hypothetical protein
MLYLGVAYRRGLASEGPDVVAVCDGQVLVDKRST